MIDLPPLWQFVVLLAAHYVGDFVLQTHWQASNKSRNNMALLEHVAVYTVVLAVVSGVIFGFGALWFSFVWMNAVAHFCTDWVTSRWSSSYFRPALADTRRVADLVDAYRYEPSAAYLTAEGINPGRHWHNFFAVIGFDQLIHQVTLATTLWLVVA